MDLDNLFKKHNIKNGSFLAYSSAKNQYRAYNLDRCRKGFLPASTFKIINSLIALEEGILQSKEDTIYWDGTERWNRQWNQNLSFQEAFKYSCVPCYQQIARQVGVSKMKRHTQVSDYGKMVIDTANLDQFWLYGDSRINQFEQIKFLRHLQANQLPFKASSLAMVKEMMVDGSIDRQVIRGKTGLTQQDGQYIGWYVGYCELKQDIIYFALNIEANEYSESFRKSRKSMCLSILSEDYL